VQAAASLRSAAPTSERTAYDVPFYLTVAYLALEYGRPQETIPGLAALHLPAIVTTLLALSLIVSARLKLGDKQTKLFLAFLILMAAHVPFAVNNYWAFEMTRQMLITFIIYLAIINFVDSYPKFLVIVNVWIVIHIYLAITGVLKGGRGIGGFLADENDFALVMNMIVPFGFFLALDERIKFRRIFLLSVTAAFVFANVLTFSRGGFVGLTAAGLYCWLRSPRKLISTVALILLTLAIIYFAPESYWQRVQTILDESISEQGSGGDRVYSWKVAWNMFLDFPLLGVGSGNFPWNFVNYEPPGGFEERLHGGRLAHSLYFTLLPEVGITGTVLFIWMLSCSLRDLGFVSAIEGKQLGQLRKEHARPPSKYLRLALECSVVGFLVGGIFISVLYYPCFWIWMAMVVSLKQSVQSVA
jgi:probable O-glycosylation ligase (exosortase A-associated)